MKLEENIKNAIRLYHFLEDNNLMEIFMKNFKEGKYTKALKKVEKLDRSLR